MDGIINGFALADYDALKDRINELEKELGEYRAKEDNLIDMMCVELNNFTDRLKNDASMEADWITVSTLYIKDVCQKLGYMALYENAVERANIIAERNAEVELFGENGYQE